MLDFKILYKFFKKLPTKKKKNTLFLSIIISNISAGIDILIAYLLSLLLNNSLEFFSYSFTDTRQIGWFLLLLTTLRFIFKNYEDHILRKFQYTIQSDLLNLYIEKLFNDVNVSLSDYFYKLNTEGDRLSRVGFGFGKIGFHLLQIIVFLAFLLYENYLIFLVFILLLISSIIEIGSFTCSKTSIKVITSYLILFL